MFTVVKCELSLFSKNTRIILARYEVNELACVVQSDILASDIEP